MQLITKPQSVVVLNDQDSVAVARKPIAQGTLVTEIGIRTGEDIPSGHKLALRDIAEGEYVIK